MARNSYARPVTPEELDTCTKSLIGNQLMTAENIDYSWFFRFGSDISIATEDAWRLIVEDRIFVTSEDHKEQFGLPEPVDAASRVLSTTIGRHVEAASISARSGDLTIDFEGRVQLQLLQLSCGYESWRLEFQGSETVCTGGGNIVIYPKL